MKKFNVVGYSEKKDLNSGIIYFKGEDGTVCLRHPRDPRPSKMIFVKKFVQELRQTDIKDWCRL